MQSWRFFTKLASNITELVVPRGKMCAMIAWGLRKGARTMLHIAVCDDDAAELGKARALLDEFIAERKLAAQVREFMAGRELLFDVDEGNTYDLYLLDVVMPEMNGIELGVKLRETDETGAILYLTTSEDFAIDSYEARAFWYLVKPVKPEKLFSILDKAVVARQKRLDDGVNVKTRNGMARVRFDGIIYAEPIERTVRYICRSGAVESISDTASFREKIAPLLSDKRFYLCGASLVLNLQHIKAVNKSSVAFSSGEQREIPRRAASELRSAWTQYWMEGGERP